MKKEKVPKFSFPGWINCAFIMKSTPIKPQNLLLIPVLI